MISVVILYRRKYLRTKSRRLLWAALCAVAITALSWGLVLLWFMHTRMS